MHQPAGIHQVDVFSSLAAKMETLTRKIDRLQSPTTPSQVFSCEWCGGGHPTGKCNTGDPNHYTFENANMINSGFRDHPYANSYNPGWRQHPDVSWRIHPNQPNYRQPMQNNQWSNHPNPLGFQHQPPPPPQEKHESSLEDLIKSFVTSTKEKFTE